MTWRIEFAGSAAKALRDHAVRILVVRLGHRRAIYR